MAAKYRILCDRNGTRRSFTERVHHRAVGIAQHLHRLGEDVTVLNRENGNVVIFCGKDLSLKMSDADKRK